MKKLLINGVVCKNEQGEDILFDKIIRTTNSVLACEGEQLYSWRGVTDMSSFQLEDGQEWDIDDKVAEFNYLLDLDFRISMIELGV